MKQRISNIHLTALSQYLSLFYGQNYGQVNCQDNYGVQNISQINCQVNYIVQIFSEYFDNYCNFWVNCDKF